MRSPLKFIVKLWHIFELFVFFIWELILANVRVAWDVVTPNQYRHKRPGVVAVPLEVRSSKEIALLACLITLTPGTLSLDVSKDRSVLYIHDMFVSDPDKVRRSIKDGFEQRVLKVFQ